MFIFVILITVVEQRLLEEFMLKDKKVFYYDSKVIRNFNFKDKSCYLKGNKKVLYSFKNAMIKWFVSKELFYVKTSCFNK